MDGQDQESAAVLPRHDWVPALRSRRAVPALESGVRWLDDRVSVARGGREILDHIFPDHWSFMLGEIAFYCFAVLIATGVWLALFFDDSSASVVYSGPDKLLVGHHVSAAYASTVNLSLQVRGGLVIRQTHHWAADIFIGVIIVHLCRVFFTGAFRKPREMNWAIGATMLFLAIINGYCGYSLPDDLMSGTGLRIGYSIILSVPLVGTYLASFLFGGQFPGNGSIGKRLFVAHVFLLPALIGALLAVHLVLIFRQKHTQFRQPHRSEYNVVGSPMFARYAFKSVGLMLSVAGGLVALGGLVQINPIWQFGPYDPYKVSYASQPDFYMGWIEGAMRLMPNWEFAGFGHTIPFDLFIPAVVMPVTTYVALVAWPWAWNKITGDRLPHQLLERPRERPGRTAFGAAMVAFYGLLLMAASDDLIAQFFDVPLQVVVWTFRIGVVVGPVAVALVTRAVATSLRDNVAHSETVVLSHGSYLPELPPVADGDGKPPPAEVPAFIVPGPAPSSHVHVLAATRAPDGSVRPPGAAVRARSVLVPVAVGVAAGGLVRAVRRLQGRRSGEG